MKTTIICTFLYLLSCYSSADDCFTMVDSCPETREKWIERSNEYTCTSGRFYTCLMINSNRSLAEACIYSPNVAPSRTGCPVFALCDERHGPIIANEFKPCAEGVIGCPTSNHSGYNLTEMFKYPECLKNSLVEKKNKTGMLLKSTTPSPSGPPNTDSGDNGHLLLKIIIPVILMLFIAIALVILWKRKRLGNCRRWKFPPKKKDETIIKRQGYHKVQQSETKSQTIEEYETNNEDKIGSFQQSETKSQTIEEYETNNEDKIGSFPTTETDVKVEDTNFNDDEEESELEQKNQNKVMLEAERDTVTQFPAEEPKRSLGILYGEHENSKGEDIVLQADDIQELRTLDGENTKIETNLNNPDYTKRTALDELEGDNFDTSPMLTTPMPSIMEKNMQSPTKPSTVACTTKGEIELAIEVYQPFPSYLGELQREEYVSVQMPSPPIQENRISRRPSSPTDSFQSNGIPSEIMKLCEDFDFKLVVTNLNVTTMELLTKAPEAIASVGRLHFVAILTVFQIGADSQEGEELRSHDSEFGEESIKCFNTAKDNISSLKFILTNVIERFRILSLIMTDEYQNHPSDIHKVIDSTSEGIDKCASLCLQTRETFVNLRQRLVPFDKSFQRARKKVDEMDSVGIKGGLDLRQSRVTSSLKNIRKLINETEHTFTELCNRWEMVTDFFQEMHSFFTRQMESDIRLYSQLKSHTECKSITKLDEGKSHPVEIVLHELHGKAKFGLMISEFYLYVSREFLAGCLQQLSRSLYLDDEREDEGMKSSSNKLEKSCVDAKRKIICLFKKIEEFINQVQYNDGVIVPKWQ